MIRIPNRQQVFVAIAPAVLVLAASLIASAAEADSGQAGLEWPAITKECRPWTYWWWMGSAVNPAELTRHLEAYSKAGMGGVHIIPIYGAQGYESRCISYLTPKWMEMLGHTEAEARRVGMGVDMTTGTGWPFGGPWVGPEDAAAKVFFATYDLAGGKRLDSPVRCKDQPDAAIRAVMAFSEAGDILDLTEKVNAGRILDWQAPAGTWALCAVFQGWTKQQVKRAAPGGEGNVMDYLSTASLQRYLARFDEAFADYQGGAVRAFYNDSYEVYGANWTDDLFSEFHTRRGYDLRRYLPAFLGKGEADQIARVRSDYRQTVADVLLERFTEPWVAWCRQKGSLTRDQAHGSPGNILDLYAASDIPETEGFGRGGAEILVSKFASSAAHLKNRPLVSSESCTWLDEHFQVSLAKVKPQIDQLFVAGINHVFFHGMTFSPVDAPYPGWLFYASTNFGLSNSFWPDLPGLNGYIARTQAFLQAGRSDNDLLLYFPIFDLWCQEKGIRDNLHFLQVHNSDTWLKENLAPTHAAAAGMWDRGFTFDYVSDRLLAEGISASAGGLRAGPQAYRALILPACKLMPPETLEKILSLVCQGSTVIVVGDLPSDVPGLSDLPNRRARLKRLLSVIEVKPTEHTGILQARLDKGRLLLGPKLEAMLDLVGVQREALTDQGLLFVRRASETGRHYFVTNPTGKAVDGWVPFDTKAKSAIIFDPRLASAGVGAIRQEAAGIRVRLQLQPGESCVVRALTDAIQGPAWAYFAGGGDSQEIKGSWDVTFVEGGPKLPGPFKTEKLASWTELGGDDARIFSGAARYTITFEKPRQQADDWVLDLGQVCESARVRLNGQDLLTLWCRPYRLTVGKALRDGTNTLEIDVTNLMANRIADMDRRKVDWKKFFFVNIEYKPFDASGWTPMPSGLLGPVNLVPCTADRSGADK